MPDDHEIYKGYKIVIEQDADAQNPRKDNDCAAKMVCFHSRYTLGDEHSYSSPSSFIAELTGLDEEELGAGHPNDDLGDGSKYRIVWEPLYLYDHSGITMSITPFSCPWDSGQVGIIYMTYADIIQSFGISPIKPDEWEPTKEIIERAEALLKGEVEEYDMYLRGDVYGYKIHPPKLDGDHETDEDDEDEFGDEEDSCWGFFGRETAVEAAKEYIDGTISNG